MLFPPVNTATPSLFGVPLFTVIFAPLSIVTLPGFVVSPTANIPTPFLLTVNSEVPLSFIFFA